MGELCESHPLRCEGSQTARAATNEVDDADEAASSAIVAATAMTSVGVSLRRAMQLVRTHFLTRKVTQK